MTNPAIRGGEARTIEALKEEARQARISALRMIYWAQSCHIGSCFSAADLVTALFSLANIDKELKEDRDKLVFSKGWIAALVYHFLAKKGIIPEKDLEDFYLPGSKYIGLVERGVRGVEYICSSMGMGITGGVGFAFAKKQKKEPGKSYVLLSDGEVPIGTTWECAAIAAHHKLDNLVFIIDYNNLCAMGRMSDVLNIEPLADRWAAFGWEVREIDGHDFKQILPALTKPHSGKPLVVIAHTIKGKGFKEFEDKMEWHYRNPEEKIYQEAMKELVGYAP